MLRAALTFSFLTIQFISFAAFSESDTSDQENIIVTGTHTPISTDEIGSSYTVITAEQIKQRQAIQLADLLRDVPGFAVSHGGVVGSQIQVRVRGAEANQLLVLIDGVEANDIAGGDEFNFAHLTTTNIERVEIIRGPQSALYGSDALAGVINIITKKGSGPTTFSAYAEGGSFGTFNSGGGISGSGDRYHYNLNGSYLSSAGDNIAPQGDEDDRYDNATISFAAGVTPLANLKFDINGRHTEADNETDNQDFGTFFPVFIPGTGLAVDADNETKVSQDYLSGQVSLNLFNDAWEHIASAAVTSIENDNFVSGVESSSTQGKKFRFDYKTNLHFDTENIADASHVLTFGVDHEKDLFTQRGTASFFGDPNQKQTAKSTGLVGGYRVGLWQRLFLSGSVRHDNNSEFRDATTYRVTAAYKLSESGTRLHGSYGTGVKRPTFSDRFGFSPNTFIGNPNLRSEKSKAWDVGIEQSLWNDRANVGFTYFHSRLEDEINGFFFNGAGFTAVNVSGISKRQGVEITADVKLAENLQLSADYTWLDATQPNAAGDQIMEVRRPRNTGNINLNYVFLNNRANANLNISHTGKQKDTNFAAFTTVDLGSYTLINLATSYRIIKNMSVYGKVENMLDKDYVDIFGFQTPGVKGVVGFKIDFQP
jgi:vitamin B12 transporter